MSYRYGSTVNANRVSGSGKITLTVTDEDAQQFSKSWKLAVRSAYPSVTETVSRVINKGEQIDIADAVEGDIEASGSVEISNSARISTSFVQ